jgi:hypothetical protein
MARTRRSASISESSPTHPQTVLVLTLATGLARLISTHTPTSDSSPDSSPTSLELGDLQAVSVPCGKRTREAWTGEDE